MKYRDISWNLMINNEQASFDDETLDFIAEEIQRGNTSGLFTADCTDYNRIDELKDKLATEIGRDADFSVEDDDKGELDELLDIALKNNDETIANIIQEILEIGFEK